MVRLDIPITALEQIEINAWADLYDAAGTLKDNPCGISVQQEDSHVVSVVADCDVLALNRVIGWGGGGQATDSVGSLNSIIDVYRRAGVPRFFVQLLPSLVETEAGVALKEAGFTHYNNWVKLYRKAEPITGVRSDLRVEKIGAARAEDFGRIVQNCFEWDERLHPWIGSTVNRPGWHLYLALDGDRPAATGAFFRSGEYAWVDMAATLSEFRGRGAQALLMQQRVADAIGLGCKHLVVETAEETPEHLAPSYRNMLRYGFQVAYVRPNFLYTF